MAIEITEMPGEPIVLLAAKMPYEPDQDMEASLQAVRDFKKKIGGHIYRVVDLTHFELTFSQAMQSMAVERNVEGGINDDDVTTVYVGSGEWVEFGVKAFLEQAQYGKTNILKLCKTVEEGLAAAREDLAKRQ